MSSLTSSIQCSVLLIMAAGEVGSAATSMSSDLLVIRHGQRYALKRIATFDKFFENPKVRWGELTPHGIEQMRDLGLNSEAVIVRAFYSHSNRCKESLIEFLAGANANISPEILGDVNYGSVSDLLQDKDIHQDIVDAFAKNIRDRDSFEDLIKEFEPSNSHASPLIHNLLGAAIIDAFAVLQDMGIQEMNRTVQNLDFDCAVAMSKGMKRAYANQLRELVLHTMMIPTPTSAEMIIPPNERNEAEKLPKSKATILMASDIHLLALLQTLTPQWATVRPAFGDILRITSLTSGVLISFHNMTDLMSWEKFNTLMAKLHI